MSMRARTFHIVQYEYHPYDAYDSNGNLKPDAEPLITQDDIDRGLSYRSIRKWAYIWHDKDVYTEEEERNDSTGRIKAGEKKKKHVHIALSCEHAIELQAVARWFNVPEQYIDVPKGAGAFLDTVEYLTHSHPNQQAKGKYLYNDDEVVSNFDWRNEVLAKTERELKYGKNLSASKRMQQDVLKYGKTLKECYEEDSILYAQNINILPKLRAEYLDRQGPAEMRMNYYVSGKGGVGKSLLCRAFACSLYPHLPPDEVYYEVQGKNVEFQNYDGQPVIIWDDYRAYDLINVCGDKGMVFKIFDTFPQGTTRVNKKYGHVPLIHSVNIVNGPDEYVVFLDALSGEYVDKWGKKFKSENKDQAYRRFPLIMELKEESINVLVNRGYALGTREYQQYETYGTMVNRFNQIARATHGDPALRKDIELKVLKPVMHIDDDIRASVKNATKSEVDMDKLLDSANKSFKPSLAYLLHKKEIREALFDEYNNVFLPLWYGMHRGTFEDPTFEEWFEKMGAPNDIDDNDRWYRQCSVYDEYVVE